jgi:hypothetical protein
MSWDEFWRSVSVYQAVAWVLGGIGVIAFLVKGWPKIRATVRLIDALGALPQFMADTTATLKSQDKKIADIHHEVHFNNGTSVKDGLNRVELGVKGIHDRLDRADTDRAELREDLEARPHPPARKRTAKPKPKE